MSGKQPKIKTKQSLRKDSSEEAGSVRSEALRRNGRRDNRSVVLSLFCRTSIDRVLQVAWTEMTDGLQTDQRRDSRHLKQTYVN